jgi:hypothetical protein
MSQAATTDRSRYADLLPLLGLSLIAICSLIPLLAETPPILPFAPYAASWARWTSKALVLFAMLIPVAIVAWKEQRREPWSWSLHILLLGLAALFIVVHGFMVDLFPDRALGQLHLYRTILNHEVDAPHLYRFLPYCFTRSLEWLTGDWLFACTVYRWYFTFWFLWCSYRFARLFHSPPEASWTLLALAVLYPFSIAYYVGQLTDPLSHTLFVLSLIYVMENRLTLLALSLALGILAKETVILVVPVYWACYWRTGWPAFWKNVLLGIVCLTAFLTARVPLGWWPGYETINGTTALMIPYNLGLNPEEPGTPLYTSAAPLYHNYLHPALFVGVFLPFIVWQWHDLDGRLKAMFLTLTPLLLASNLCFGWMYESRNYMPLVPLLTTIAVPGRAARLRRLLISEPTASDPDFGIRSLQ